MWISSKPIHQSDFESLQSEFPSPFDNISVLSLNEENKNEGRISWRPFKFYRLGFRLKLILLLLYLDKYSLVQCVLYAPLRIGNFLKICALRHKKIPIYTGSLSLDLYSKSKLLSIKQIWLQHSHLSPWCYPAAYYPSYKPKQQPSLIKSLALFVMVQEDHWVTMTQPGPPVNGEC